MLATRYAVVVCASFFMPYGLRFDFVVHHNWGASFLLIDKIAMWRGFVRLTDIALGFSLRDGNEGG